MAKRRTEPEVNMARSRRSRTPRQRDVTPVDLPVDPALLAQSDPDATDSGPSTDAGGPHGIDAAESEAVQLEIDLFEAAAGGDGAEAPLAELELADAEAREALADSEAEAQEIQAAADASPDRHQEEARPAHAVAL